VPDNPTFQIPKDVIEPILKAHVAAAITEAFGDRSKLIEQMITSVLMGTVDDKGRPTYSSAYGASPLLEWMMKDAIGNAVREVMAEQLVKYKEQVKDAIVSTLRAKRSPLARKLAEALVNGITAEETLKWRLTVDVAGLKDGY
jgi:hypothetical protein